MPWNPREKSPADVCPRAYCCHWLEPGALFAPGLHARLATATRQLRPVPEGGCGCTFGVCVRCDPARGDHDWYEANTPNLARDGFPWFYFYPHEGLLVPEVRGKYREESRRLWGGGGPDAGDEGR